MGRLVEPPQTSVTPTGVGKKGESYSERVAKYVPAEVIGGYMPLMSMSRTLPPEQKIPVAWAVFVVAQIATPLYLLKVGRPRPNQRLQLVISTIAFALWAYTLGGPAIEATPQYTPTLAAIVAGVFTLLAGLYKG